VALEETLRDGLRAVFATDTLPDNPFITLNRTVIGTKNRKDLDESKIKVA
jgi:hypothetical protein